MFVIIHDNFVVWGPKPWNKLGFEDVLRTDCEVEYTLPIRNDAQIPYIINETTKILKVVTLPNPEINSKIQTLNGPYWNFYDDYVEMYYEPQDLPLEFVKGTLKGIIASKRYDKEIAGFVMSVQGNNVTIDTSREGRSIYFDTYLALGAEETVGWKFPEMWLNLSKTDLGQIVFAGKSHIQSSFVWESTKAAEIDAATTLEELDAISLEVT